MKINKLNIAALLLLLSATTIDAQEVMTLDAYSENVLEYSQQLKQAKENVISATAQRKVARTGFLPKIDLAANASLDLTNVDSWDTPLGTYKPHTFFAGAILTQNIWLGGSDQAKYRSGKIDEQIQIENEELTIDNIFLQAEIAYWTLSAQTEFLNVQEKYLKLIQEQYDIIKLRFDDGAIAKNDFLMIATRLKQAEFNLKRAQTAYDVANQNFNILMGVDPNAENVITTPIQAASTETPSQVSFDTALNQRPEYNAAYLQVELLNQNRKLAVSKFNPALYFQVQGGWGTATPNLGYKPSALVISSINFSMPLVRWNERRNTNRQFKALVNSSVFNQQIVEDKINQEVANAWTNMDQTFTQIQVAEETFAIASESLDLNTFSYNEGRINIADLLSSQLSWLEAYTNTINSHYSFKISVAQYKRATGEM